MQLCLKHSGFSFEELTSNFTVQLQAEKDSMIMRTRRQGKLEKLIFSNRLWFFFYYIYWIRNWILLTVWTAQVSKCCDLFLLGYRKDNCPIATSSPSSEFKIYSWSTHIDQAHLQQIYNLIIFSLWILFSLELPSTKLYSRKILLGKLIIL